MRIQPRNLSFDWVWFAALLILSSAGLLAIWSTTGATGLNSYFGKQLLCLGIGVVAFLLILYFDYHLFSDYIALTYTAGMAVLGLVLVVGRTVHSSKSWIDIGKMTVQPSELMKVLAIVALAKYYSESEREHLEINELVTGGAMGSACRATWAPPSPSSPSTSPSASWPA